MRILMVGAGATGGYFGGRLALAGRDVTFLVRGARREQLQRDGLRLSGPRGEAQVSPKLITADELAAAGAFDVVLISTKAYSLDTAMADFAPAVGAETVVIPLLNGMKHIDVLRERFGDQLFGGSVRIVADVTADGRIEQMGQLAELTFGELSKERTARAERLLEQFTVPGFEAKLSDDVVAALWSKWWFLASMGAVCVVGGGSVGEVVAAEPWGVATALAITQECADIAAANGYAPKPEMVEQHGKRMTEAGSSLTSSMYRDMKKGLPVEVDQILGDFLSRAKGVAAPLLKGAYVQLKVYEAKRAK